MRINWTGLSSVSGVPVDVLITVYGQQPLSFEIVAAIVVDLEVAITDVLTLHG